MKRFFSIVLLGFVSSAFAQQGVFPSGGAASTSSSTASTNNIPVAMNNGTFASGRAVSSGLSGFPDDPRIRITVIQPKKEPPAQVSAKPERILKSADTFFKSPPLTSVPQPAPQPILEKKTVVAAPTISLPTPQPACFNGVRLQWLNPVPVAWDMASGVRDITKLNNQYDTSASLSGYDSLGVTVAKLSFSNKTVTAANGCSEIHVSAGYSWLEIKIARELTKNACATEHIRTHELKHVAIYEKWTAKMQAEMPEKISYFLLKNPTPTANEVMKFIESEWLKVRALHRELDSPEEYRENDYACDRAIPRLLRNVPLS